MAKKPAYEELEQRVEDMEPGNHLCCIYETEEEHRALFTPFVRQGLERGEKMLYIVDAHTAEEILNYLRDDGIEVEPYLNKGQLTILTVDEAYMREGVFDPDGMIAFLSDEMERALEEGYSALRVTGEMTWALRGLPGSERLIEYEAKFNDFFHGSKCLAICQYDRKRFGPAVLLDVLSTHPIIVTGMKIFENFYYLPPKDFLSHNPEAAKLDNWLNNLGIRAKTEEDLRESEAKYRSLFENMLNGFAYCKIFLDEKGLPIDFVYLEVNDSFERLTGLRKEDIVGKKVTEAIPAIKDTHPELFDIYGKVALTGKEAQFDIYFEPLEKWLSVSVYSPQKGYFVAVFDNITERKKAMEALQKSNDNLAKAQQITHIGSWEWDIETDQVSWSDEMYRIYGVDPDKLREKLTAEVIFKMTHPDDIDRVQKNSQRMLKEGRPISVEYRVLQPDGTVLTVHGEGDMIFDNNGKSIRMIGTVQDITERKRAEQALKEKQKELEMKAGNLEEVNTALRVILKKREEDKTKIEENMLSNVKELVEPYLEKLKESRLDVTQMGFVSVLESNINDIISPFASRLSSKFLNLSPSEVRVANLVKQGRGTKEIAGLMSLSTKTIATHRRNIRKKLGIMDKKANLRTHLLSIQE